MSHFFTSAILTATIAAGIAYAAPFLLAALGETVGQRSGVLNLGVDGIMLLSAFGSYYTALQTGNLVYAVFVGIGIGIVMGVITAFISVTLKAEQGISGIGVYLFGLGLSDLLFVKLVGTPQPVQSLHNFNIPLLARIPAVGHMFFKQNVLVYIAFLFVPVLAFVLNRTTYGMKIQAAGENPAAADSLGVSVTRIRYSTVIFGSAMAGSGRRHVAHHRRDLPAEPHPERRVHRRGPRLLRGVASVGGHGRLLALRPRDLGDPAVEDAGDHPDVGRRSRRHRPGRHHRAGAPHRRAALPPTLRTGQALHPGHVTCITPTAKENLTCGPRHSNGAWCRC